MIIDSKRKKGFDKINEKCKTSQMYFLLLKIFQIKLSPNRTLSERQMDWM